MRAVAGGAPAAHPDAGVRRRQRVERRQRGTCTRRVPGRARHRQRAEPRPGDRKQPGHPGVARALRADQQPRRAVSGRCRRRARRVARAPSTGCVRGGTTARSGWHVADRGRRPADAARRAWVGGSRIGSTGGDRRATATVSGGTVGATTRRCRSATAEACYLVRRTRDRRGRAAGRPLRARLGGRRLERAGARRRMGDLVLPAGRSGAPRRCQPASGEVPLGGVVTSWDVPVLPQADAAAWRGRSWCPRS